MLRRALSVWLAGRRIGGVTQANDRLSFAYSDEWRQRPTPTPLSVSMPVARRTHSDPVVRAYLWGLLPDSDAVLQRWGREFHVSPRNPFALLAHVGSDCPGAVQLAASDATAPEFEDASAEELDDAAIGARIRRLEQDPTAWHGLGLRGEFSLAGAQAKFALAKTNGGWVRPIGGGATTHIFKPAIHGLAHQDLNEHICAEAARMLGLPTVRTEMRRFDGASALVIERYDRLRTAAGSVQRVHQEDLCQASGTPPQEKYQADGGPSAVDVVELLRREMPVDIAVEAVARFVDALLLNWLLAGTDAHAKNYSLLLAGPAVRLAPLYDLNSVIPFTDTLHRAKLAMRIGGTYRLTVVSARHWARLAAGIGIPEDAIRDRGLALADALPDALATVCSRDALAATDTALVRRLRDGVGDWASRCRAQLDAAAPAPS